MTSLINDAALSTDSYNGKKLPSLLDDSYLLEKLEELSLSVENSNDIKPLDASVDESLEESNVERYSKYARYIDQLNSNIEEYKVVLTQTKTVSDQVIKIINNFEDISKDTNEFINDTNQLHGEYIKVSKLHEAIPEFLQYFESLDPIMRRLKHATSANIVRKDSFKTLMVNIEQSLQFLDEHTDFKDYDSYRIKFKQCLIRGCELIANYLKNLLRHSYNDVYDMIKRNVNDESSGSREALIYIKFATIAEEFMSQITELAGRSNNKNLERYSNEINSILNDCYNEYFHTRWRLLNSAIHTRLNEFDSANTGDLSLIKFIQDTKTYFQQLCLDEYRLYIQFFPEKYCKPSINMWFLSLCEPFYDSCTSRILREKDITALCDALTLFSKYYEFEEGSEEYLKHFKEVQFDKVFQPIVQTLQQRLIFRAQQYVDREIVQYTPTIDSFMITNRKTAPNGSKPLDFENDSILKAYIDGFSNNTMDTDEIENKETLTSREIELEKCESFYPPLIKAIALLSKIYEMIHTVVFDDLAHHIVHDCVLSLKNAYVMVVASTSDAGSNKLDMDLAYLKNLLLLREQIENFNIEYTVTETYLDFSAVESFFRTIREGAKFKRSEYSVLSLARDLVPKVVNNMVDARYELMQELRNIIKNFTEAASKDIVRETFKFLPGDKGESLIAKNVELRSNIEDRLPRIFNQISTFIDDDGIVVHLMEAIQEVVVHSYSEFFKSISDRQKAGEFDNLDISELMDIAVFSDFFETITKKLISSQNEKDQNVI
ncbi:hypothetical protein Kpol_1032p42 [Vanderwaltozyma polyspora DSM 70294]|uniref:Conserved oligomeric Golgi complex subunit 3 n=1 Tax=Vanderwaltozyma polyspora (strain ATCC 22028 / DSM 70294 / BCRC 21397 / CBS 2163 / NBRC 10782 / NRRL Y-8283 / UCD 57-17) TaxID=436907 RepID=A7TGZ6_VANPO|nr:uncharacterized protein Kpol_1032p42 [Vanderwaltozyma polyspora DSM 70294]EDO18448.1 hypothetical protein Kpol_1032p42 [Vanderwaltozyma polyspora DSM 70294]